LDNDDQTLATDPKSEWLRSPIVKEHVPGIPWGSVGYPAKKAVSGAAGASLVDGQNDIDDLKLAGEWTAKQRPYPAADPVVPGIPKGGKMSAKDVEGSIGMITKIQGVINAGDAADAAVSATKEEMRMRKMKKLLAGIKSDPTERADLNSGGLLQQLGIMKGNIGNCQKQKKQCEARRKREELGESDQIGPTTTATQDANKASGDQNDFLLNAKSTPSTEQPRTTATDDYQSAQDGGPWDRLDGQPGMKLPHDRMPASHLQSMVGITGYYISQADEMEKKDAERDVATIQDAQHKLISAEIDQDKADTALEAMDAPKTTSGVLAEVESASAELQSCMDVYLDVCKQKFNEGTIMSFSDVDPKNKHENPRDSQEFAPDTTVNPKMGPGGDSPIVKSDPPPDRP